jgi:hypothetical protein
MIKVGDIVFKKYTDGMIKYPIKVDYSKIGLVLECYKPEGCLAQFKVSFHGSEPAWWEGRHLHLIEGDKEK